MASHAHTETFFSRTHTHGHSFTQRWFYIEQPYTQIMVLLQRNGFTRGAFIYGCFYTGILLHDFRRLARNFRATSVQQADVKPQFHRSFWRLRRSFLGKGLAQCKPTLQFHFNWGRSTFRARGLRFMDINPRRSADWRENWENFWTCRRLYSKKLISTCIFTSATLCQLSGVFWKLISACACASAAIHQHLFMW